MQLAKLKNASSDGNIGIDWFLHQGAGLKRHFYASPRIVHVDSRLGSCKEALNSCHPSFDHRPLICAVIWQLLQMQIYLGYPFAHWAFIREGGAIAITRTFRAADR